MAAATRIIKKYPNRRLYDTGISSYITLDDIRQLVLDGEVFTVREATTNSDLTRSVLLQVIAEHEQHGQPLLSVPLLRRLIGLYGDALQGFMSLYLERSLDVFADQQHPLRNQLDNLMEQAPKATLDALVERTQTTWGSARNGTPGTPPHGHGSK